MAPTVAHPLSYTPPPCAPSLDARHRRLFLGRLSFPGSIQARGRDRLRHGKILTVSATPADAHLLQFCAESRSAGSPPSSSPSTYAKWVTCARSPARRWTSRGSPPLSWPPRSHRARFAPVQGRSRQVAAHTQGLRCGQPQQVQPGTVPHAQGRYPKAKYPHHGPETVHEIPPGPE
jgi:hypothetical protein